MASSQKSMNFSPSKSMIPRKALNLFSLYYFLSNCRIVVYPHKKWITIYWVIRSIFKYSLLLSYLAWYFLSKTKNEEL